MPHPSRDDESSAAPIGLLGALTALVPFLGGRVGRPAPGELTAAALGRDPDRLAAAVADTASGWGCDDPVVLASIWWQGYAYRVAGTTLACWVLNGAAPDPSAGAGTAVGLSAARPAWVVYGPDAEPVADPGDLVERLFAGHLDVIVSALRTRHRLGLRLAWGNVASAVASALAATGTAPGAPPLARRVEDLTAALPHGIGSLGAWRFGEDGWSYVRRTCCLWWKTAASGGVLCEDCSLR